MVLIEVRRKRAIIVPFLRFPSKYYKSCIRNRSKLPEINESINGVMYSLNEWYVITHPSCPNCSVNSLYLPSCAWSTEGLTFTKLVMKCFCIEGDIRIRGQAGLVSLKDLSASLRSRWLLGCFRKEELVAMHLGLFHSLSFGIFWPFG